MPYKDPDKTREASKRFYEANRELTKRRSRARNIIARKAIHEWLHNYLLTHPCVDCGEANPIILEFDHLRDKHFAIGNAAKMGVSLKKLAAEVAKCEVRCANCHRHKTYKAAGRKHRG